MEKMFRCRDEPIKRMKTTPRRKHTRRLPQYRNMVEKKKTQRLPCICCTSNRYRVVFVSFSFPPYLCITDAGQSLCLFLFNHIYVVGQSSCVFSSRPCFHPFFRFIPTSNEFLKEIFFPQFLLFFLGGLCTKLCKLTAMILIVFYEYNPISRNL